MSVRGKHGKRRWTKRRNRWTGKKSHKTQHKRSIWFIQIGPRYGYWVSIYYCCLCVIEMLIPLIILNLNEDFVDLQRIKPLTWKSANTSTKACHNCWLLIDRQTDRQNDQEIGFISVFDVLQIEQGMRNDWCWIRFINLALTLVHVPVYLLISMVVLYVKLYGFLRYFSSLSCTILIARFAAEVCSHLLRNTHLLSLDLWNDFMTLCQCMVCFCIQNSVKCSTNNSSVMTI